MQRYAALIPARAGSKGIPAKNVRPVGGKPLVQWVVEAAAASSALDGVFVATDCSEVGRIVRSLKLPKVTVVGRTPRTATDEASTESVMLEFLDGHPATNLVLIQPTSPLLTTADIDGAVGRFEQRGADSLVSVCRQKRFLWEEQGEVCVPLNYDPATRPRRQDFAGFLVENGALYIGSAEGIVRTACRLHGKTVAWEMGPETYVELDDPVDFRMVEQLLVERERARFRDRLAGISLVLLDVDGVLTDAGMYYGHDGEVLKKFNTRDGMGIRRLREAGVEVAIVTGESSPIVAERARKLGVREVHLGIEDKRARVDGIRAMRYLEWENLAFVGDDINDLGVMGAVGFAAAVADAMPEVKAVAHHVTERPGGHGAVREVAEMILAEVKPKKKRGSGAAKSRSQHPSPPRNGPEPLAEARSRNDKKVGPWFRRD